MFTPQEIQEKTFVKAIFGGYDMTCVDEFLEPLSNDYIALYKENAVLKSKMKILVEKLEEYRAQEDTMKKTLVAATEAAEKLKADTERKCAQMLSQAENAARSKKDEAAAQIAGEEERIDRARMAAANFIEIVEREVSRHLDQLATLKAMDMAARPLRPRPYDFEREATAPPANGPDEVRKIAEDIERSISSSEDLPPQPEEPAPQPERKPKTPSAVAATQATIKFSDLQFGKNYDPNRE